MLSHIKIKFFPEKKMVEEIFFDEKEIFLFIFVEDISIGTIFFIILRKNLK